MYINPSRYRVHSKWERTIIRARCSESGLRLTTMWLHLSVQFIFQSASLALSPCVCCCAYNWSTKEIECPAETGEKSFLQAERTIFIPLHSFSLYSLASVTLISTCLLLPRSFKEAGICLKNYAFKCMEDEARIKTGLILSGISLVGGAFCVSQKDKEGQ